MVESSSDSDDTATEVGSRLQHQSVYSDNNSMAVEGTMSNGQEVFSEPRLPHRRHSESQQVPFSAFACFMMDSYIVVMNSTVEDSLHLTFVG
jgi:hypothetical protein